MVAEGPRYFVHCVSYRVTFHGTQIDVRAIVDFLGSQNCAAYGVIDVGPIANLLPVAPDVEGVQLHKATADDGDDGVVFNAARTVYSEIAARRALHVPVFVGMTEVISAISFAQPSMLSAS